MLGLKQNKHLLFEKIGTSNRKNQYYYIDEHTVELVIIRKNQNQKLSVFIDNDEGLLKELQKVFWNFKTKNKVNEYQIFNVDTRTGSLKQWIYGYFYGYFKGDSSRPKKVLMKEFDGETHNYKINNLTNKIKESIYVDDFMEKARENAQKTIVKMIDETVKIRMGSSYSKNLSEAKKEGTRKKSKLNEEMVETIRKDYYEKGTNQYVLSDMYGVSRTLVADIVNYRIWNQYEIEPEDIIVERTIKEAELEEYVKEDEFKLKPFNFKQIKVGEFIYSFKQNVDEQYYMSKHNDEGKYLSDVHLYFVDGERKVMRKNFIICKVRGNAHEGYKMSKKEIYDVLWSVHCAAILWGENELIKI